MERTEFLDTERSALAFTRRGNTDDYPPGMRCIPKGGLVMPILTPRSASTLQVRQQRAQLPLRILVRLIDRELQRRLEQRLRLRFAAELEE